MLNQQNPKEAGFLLNSTPCVPQRPTVFNHSWASCSFLQSQDAGSQQVVGPQVILGIMMHSVRCLPYHKSFSHHKTGTYYNPEAQAVLNTRSCIHQSGLFRSPIIVSKLRKVCFSKGPDATHELEITKNRMRQRGGDVKEC